MFAPDSQVIPGVQNSLEKCHFVESTTGDVYRFRAGKKEFVPYKNIGMRRKMPRGRGPNAPMSSFLGDVTVSKKVKYNNHFAFQGKLDLRHWKVYTELAWDIHTDNQPEGNGLSVLADSEKGFMIVESGNALGIRFFVTKRCPEAIALLDAFIATKHANMIDREYLDLSAQHAYFDEDHPLQVCWHHHFA